jgi:Cu/Ag efflux protein CusF
MLRSFISGRVLATLAVVVLAVPFAAAQERGENINGFITSVDGRNLVIKNDDGREIRIRVSPSTEVYFQDSGDRKLFPNPGIDDLRSGLGVHFNFNDGAPTRVVVHFVPQGFVRGSTASTSSGTEEYKARIQSIDRTGRQITADVQGRSRTFAVENRRDVQGLRTGDMVTIWVEDRGRGPVITRLESADQTGTIVRIDPRYRSVTISVNGRDETYDVDNRKLLEALHDGDRVRFEVENRGSRQVVTNVSRLSAR